MASGIYWLYQKSQDRAVYVGSSSNIEARFRRHRSELKLKKHTNSYLQHVWDKYQADDFQFKVLEVCAAPHLLVREQFWADALSPLCNLGKFVEHPTRGRKMPAMSEETRQRMIAALKGRPVTEETRQKLRKANIGKKNNPITKETRVKMRAAHVGKTLTEEHRRKIGDANRGKTSHNKGKRLSEETRHKISNALMGKVPSEETRRKLRDAAMRRAEHVMGGGSPDDLPTKWKVKP